MRILIAFEVAFGIGAGSRWTGIPSLAPQAIVGALLIVAMSTEWVTADRILTHKPAAIQRDWTRPTAPDMVKIAEESGIAYGEGLRWEIALLGLKEGNALSDW